MNIHNGNQFMCPAIAVKLRDKKEIDIKQKKEERNIYRKSRFL